MAMEDALENGVPAAAEADLPAITEGIE